MKPTTATPTPISATRPEDSPSKLGIAAAVLFLIIAGFLAYRPSLPNEFLNYDDPDYVTKNPNVLDGLSRNGLAWAISTSHASNWHPLTWISHQADATLFGPTDATGPHAVNLVLHIATALTLFAALLYATGRTWPAWAVAALFLLHPVNVESVAWIAQRKTLLSTLLGFLSILFYFGWCRAPGFLRYASCLLAFALSLTAKPTLVTLPLLLLLLDLWPLDRLNASNLVRRLVEKLPFALLAIASSAATLWAQRDAIASDAVLPLHVRLANAVVSYVDYLRIFVYPIDLVPIYPHPMQSPSTARLIFASLLLAAITLFAWLARRHRYLGVGWTWFLLAFLPMIGLIQVGVHAIADRYAYVPFVGLFVAVVWLIADVTRHTPAARTAVSIVVLGVLIVLGTQVHRQASIWHDSVRLFEHTLARTKGNFVAHSHLAAAYQERGDLALAARHQEAAYDAGLRDIRALVNLGTLWANLGRYEDAGRILREAIERNPRYVPACLALAELELLQGNRKEGLLRLNQTLSLDPDNERALQLRRQFGR